jgi:hypothetical protein
MSYRREETAYPAGWLFDRLTGRYGADQVFRDVDSIQLGDDFVEVITRAVGSCDVLLALIGQEWLTMTDAHGRRRLDDPDDFVRLEIEAALSRGVRVIPILVDGASMPRPDELPDSLVPLVRRQALELSPARFDFDTGRLLKALDHTLAEVRATQEQAGSIEAQTGKASHSGVAKLQEAPGQREQAERNPASSIPRAAPATPVGAQPRSNSERPPGKQRRPLLTPTRVLVGAGLGVVLILLIVAMVPRSGRAPSPTGAVTTTSSQTNASVEKRNALLAVVPDNIEATCIMYEHDEILGESSAFMQCSSAGVSLVRLGLYEDKDSLYRNYWNRVSKADLSKDYGRNYCEDNKPAESPWKYEGKPKDAGRYFCYRDSNNHAWIEWTYDEPKVYAYAYRTDGNIKGIYQWWFNL